MLSGREKFRTNIKTEEYRAMGDILKIGTSAGGVRPKAVIVYNRDSGEVRSGQGAAPGGFEHWVIKLDGVSDAQFGSSHGFGRVEYAYYLMAKDCGIQMMESELLEENDRSHFMTRRFDREDSNTKHHIQSLCGIQHMDFNDVFSFSYEQLFQVMRMLKLTYPEAEQMYRRMVFNVLAHNCDDHTKNFAFRLKQNGRWELAPAFDICYAYDPKNVWVNQQSLSINGKRSDIRKEDLLTLARANNIRRGEQIIDEIKEVICNWKAYAKSVKVSSQLDRIISSTLPAFNFH
jgi:serine/threonine-protein kinase HipA